MKQSINISAIEQYAIDVVTSLRIKGHLSQDDLAKVIGVRKSFIGNVENTKNPSKYNLKHLNLIAAHFDISPKIFVPRKPIAEDPSSASYKSGPSN